MVTAIHDLSTALEAIRRGAYDYILKPFEKDQLYLSVRRALERRRLVLENLNYQRTLEKQVEERTAQLQGALQQLEQSYDGTTGSPGQRAGPEGRRDRRALQARDRLYNCHRQGNARGAGAAAANCARRFPS